MSGQILNFPQNVRKASSSIVIGYENHLCHQIFLQERIEGLEIINNSHDLLKHAANKTKPLIGDMKFITLAYLNNPSLENWEALKDLKISNKKTAMDVFEYYKNKTKQDLEISRDVLLSALKYVFDEDFQGYKERLAETSEKLVLIKKMYPSIDSQVDLSKIN